MDEFVRNKLTKWGFTDLIERFKDQGIDKEGFECLEEQDINDLIEKVGPRAKIRRLMKRQHDLEEAADCAQAGPSSSDSTDKGNKKPDNQGQFKEMQPAKKKRRLDSNTSLSEENMLLNVKNIMKNVYNRLHLVNSTKFIDFLKNRICDLEIDKREVVGVFGRTGAGKSSLINSVIGKIDLLPSGDVSACTSVIIKVEANMYNLKYVAEIEFIKEEEWNDELWSSNYILDDNQEDDDDYNDIIDKLSAVYGEEWKGKSCENLMDEKYFREIPEFKKNLRKTLTCESAKELSAKLARYTRTESSDGAIKRWYWPLVKCVTVKVPNNPLLQHVTLIDLPGCGDCDKSRDKMWKELVGLCSTMWIVTDINRAAADKEAWDILENASSLIGNGGQCQQIHFICTKTDLEHRWNDLSANAVRVHIVKRNMDAKKVVIKEFNKKINIKKHFSEDCFKVFTVSSTEFLKGKQSKTSILRPDETEIPKLQTFLQNLNDCHSETLNYVSGAHGILSLMQGARSRGMANVKNEVYSRLKGKLMHEIQKILKSMQKTYEAFRKCLTDGVKISEDTCEATLRSMLYPRQKSNGFHNTLKSTVVHRGVHKTKKGKPINLNVKLRSKLTDSIDDMFRNTFPNEGKHAFNGVISAFSLDTEKLIEKYKVVELQLIFLKTEEEKIKTKLNKIIREEKKNIYRSLTDMIEEAMQDGYKKAASFDGQNMLKNMRKTLEKHVHDSKNIMFRKAKDVMLTNLQKLMNEISKMLGTVLKTIELSLKTDDHFIPDFSTELELVKKYYKRGPPK